ncbi:cytochrome P450 [Streptomyces sudanensis]|uniref:cytochrome P450 n=1 Tax=Streptomyces sudanensis TaxID=436397 RepID=UPI0020CEC271|nr:cytochrome P450 [Streptomyces sudanensis]MCP9960012.1 cytochrome P450 [Streptomyces sudanensis]MCP9999585.1 cytochrome P450 [Streptomyces sudanensis]
MIEDTVTRPPLGPPPVRFWPALDLKATEFDPVLEELMREGPVTRIRLPHGEGWAWLVTRYEDVKAVTNDPRFSRAPVPGLAVTRLAPHFKPKPGSLAFAEPPDHNRLRRAIAPAFSARGVERLRGRAREMLDALVAGMLRDGPPADLIARVLGPFPTTVICELMGVPAADRERMSGWVDQILFPANGAAATGRAKDEMYAWFAREIAARTADPGDGEDILSLLGAAVAAGDITAEEAVGLVGPVQIGGEAVTNNCGNMLYLLLTRERLRERLLEEPEARPRALDELLRYIPHRSSVGLARIALEDVELRGVRIAAGDAVYVSYLAANRDPEVFPDPERIDFDRSPNPHVSFGHGPHFCTGALLARMETELLVEAFLDRLPAMRLAVPAEEVPWRRSALIRGPEALPVTW